MFGTGADYPQIKISNTLSRTYKYSNCRLYNYMNYYPTRGSEVTPTIIIYIQLKT